MRQEKMEVVIDKNEIATAKYLKARGYVSVLISKEKAPLYIARKTMVAIFKRKYPDICFTKYGIDEWIWKLETNTTK